MSIRVGTKNRKLFGKVRAGFEKQIGRFGGLLSEIKHSLLHDGNDVSVELDHTAFVAGPNAELNNATGMSIGLVTSGLSGVTGLNLCGFLASLEDFKGVSISPISIVEGEANMVSVSLLTIASGSGVVISPIGIIAKDGMDDTNDLRSYALVNIVVNPDSANTSLLDTKTSSIITLDFYSVFSKALSVTNAFDKIISIKDAVVFFSKVASELIYLSIKTDKDVPFMFKVSPYYGDRYPSNTVHISPKRA